MENKSSEESKRQSTLSRVLDVAPNISDEEMEENENTSTESKESELVKKLSETQAENADLKLQLQRERASRGTKKEDETAETIKELKLNDEIREFASAKNLNREETEEVRKVVKEMNVDANTALEICLG